MEKRQHDGPDLAALPNRLPWNQLDEPSTRGLLNASYLATLNRHDHIDAELGIVRVGVLAIERALSDGRRVLADLFHEGDLIDLSQSKRVREGQLVALKPSEFLVLDGVRSEISTVGNASIAQVIMLQLRHHLARSRDHAADLVSKTPLEKAASVLFEFQRWPDTNDDDRQRNMVKIPIQRVDIADYIGVKPETLSRIVRQLEGEFLVKVVEQDRILLADIPSLRRIANGGRPRCSTKKA